MEHPHEPIDAINEWQRWYKENNNVSLRTHKDMTTVSSFTLPSITDDKLWRQSIVNGFADTITEAMADMSGAEIYKCFLQAAQENLKHAEKEYKNAKQLVDYLTCKQ
jgi:hypothetical protein